MTIRQVWRRLLTSTEDREPVVVDLSEIHRKRQAQESERDQAIEADSKILRTSARCRRMPRRRIRAIH